MSTEGTLDSAKVNPKLPLTWTYFNVIAPVVRHFLQRRYGYDLAKKAYDGSRPIYQELIDHAPAIGEGNPMAANIYESCVFFALYRAADGDITPDMMRAVVRDIFALPLFKVRGLVLDLRKQATIDRLNATLQKNKRWADERPEIVDATWDFNFDDDREGAVVHYHFTRCPINDLCRAEGLMDILPVMCEIDEIKPPLAHGRLTRKHTLALGGPCCDYLIEGV